MQKMQIPIELITYIDSIPVQYEDEDIKCKNEFTYSQHVSSINLVLCEQPHCTHLRDLGRFLVSDVYRSSQLRLASIFSKKLVRIDSIG
jgi:hypothetical protein